MAFFGMKQHSTLLEVRDGREAPTGRGIFNADIGKGKRGQNFGGSSVIDVSGLADGALSDSETVTALGNLGAHEIFHDVSVGHSGGSQENLLNDSADETIRTDPNLEFPLSVAPLLQDRFNTDEEQEQIDEEN